jgi:hypothetical protein
LATSFHSGLSGGGKGLSGRPSYYRYDHVNYDIHSPHVTSQTDKNKAKK